MRLQLYVEGAEDSVYFDLPASPAEVDKIHTDFNGIGNETQQVDIIGVSTPIQGLSQYIAHADVTNPEHMEKLNTLATHIDRMDDRKRNLFAGALDSESINGLDDVLRISESLDDYVLFPGVLTDTDLGRYLVASGYKNFPDYVRPYLDYRSIGIEYYSVHGGAYSPGGYVRRKNADEQTASEESTIKLYMPLNAELFYYDEDTEDYDMSGDGVPQDGWELLAYKSEIKAALAAYRMPEEAQRGLMHWYADRDGADKGVDQKVQSVVFTAEERDGQLWGVAECQVTGRLTLEELTTLKDYIRGQASDGWGEGFEQQEIKVGEREAMLFAHLWSSEDGWAIMTEEERFGPQAAKELSNTMQMGGM